MLNSSEDTGNNRVDRACIYDHTKKTYCLDCCQQSPQADIHKENWEWNHV